MPNIFLCGTLAGPPLCDAAGEAATLPGHHLTTLAEGAVILPAPGGDGVAGLLATVDDSMLARLDFLARALGAVPSTLSVVTETGEQAVTVWTAAQTGTNDAPSPALTAALHAAIPDILALQGQQDPAQIVRRLSPMLVRAASRLRARTAPPQSLRRVPEAGDVVVRRHHTPYANFFALEEADLSFRRFDGSLSPTVNRAAFISGDAVTLLPYDPARDRVLIIEQFRAGPFLRGDPNPWSLEAIAGRIDAGETPEEAGRREAMEEAGLTPGTMIPVANYYPSPAAKIEFLYSYIALCDLPDGAAGVFGVEGEAEDIRGHLIPFDRLMALVASGEVGNAPLILSALWLDRERPRLRADVSPR